jgi:hypothetical protein
MAQLKIDVVEGQHPDAFAITSDATSLSTSIVRVIVADTVPASKVFKALDDVKLRIMDRKKTTGIPT